MICLVMLVNSRLLPSITVVTHQEDATPGALGQSLEAQNTAKWTIH